MTMKAGSVPTSNPTPPQSLRDRRRPLFTAPSVLLISLTLILTFTLLHLHPDASPAFLHIPGRPPAPDAAESVILYASSYSGTVTALNLTLTSDGNATLRLVSESKACAPSPSWLTLDANDSVLYCTNEGLMTDHGSVSAFNVSNGRLTLLGKVDTVIGPVSAVQYGDEGRGLAVAQYIGSSLTTINVTTLSALTLLNTTTFTLPSPGPVPSRQEAPHPHQVAIDPTCRFLLVPDLGADLVRVYLIDPATLALHSIEPLVTAPGSGPRHVVFFESPTGVTYLYLVSELANTITSYAVWYSGNDEIRFDRVFQCPTHGAGNTVPEGAAAAEIAISPDNRFLTVSSRNERSFIIPSPDAEGSDATGAGDIESDSLITYLISPETGELVFLQKFPAGGLIPRHFSMNGNGSLIAVAVQQDGRVVILRRSVETGQLKEIIASIKLEGEVTAVIFADKSEV
ncbi:Lactonase, 7-bladed beta-propeller-domain-containing protein [Verticillium dahliae]|nr:Lactonase, 7-bladed beta-propeller-domain-containing protein [Verticillium dahliae]